MNVLTNSRRACFQRCRKEHLYAYIMGRRPVRTSAALGFGTLAHAGLEAWWLAWRGIQTTYGVGMTANDEPLAAALDGVRQSFYGVAEEATLNEFDLVRAQELMRGYDARWSDAMAELEVVDVEREFACKLVNPSTGHPSRTFVQSGKIDAIVRKDGEFFLVEHKTTSSDISPAQDYWLRLRIDGQVSTYYGGARSLGYDVVGCLYDVIRKPATKPLRATPPASRKYKKDGTLYANQREHDETPDDYRVRLRDEIAEHPEKYFQRGDVVRLEHDVDEHGVDSWWTAQSMRLAEQLGAHPRNPDACIRYGSFCSYFDVCTGAASIEDDARFRLMDTVHPELSRAS